MPSKASRLPDPATLATLGVCIYLVGFAFPVPWQLPLLILVACVVVASLGGGARPTATSSVLNWSVVLFLVATAMSILGSVDRERSLELSAAWIPGVLLFVVIHERIRSADRIRILYACLAFVAGALAITLLVATFVRGPNPHEWLGDLGIPVLVVPNDCNFLALLSPLALVLAIEKPRSGFGILGAIAVGLVAIVIGVFASRGAALTMAVSLVVAAGLIRPRLGLGVGAVLLAGFLLIDGLQGFALASKFTRVVDSRISLWMMAWEMFQNAPWLGNGPATYKTLYPVYIQTMKFPEWVVMDPWGGAVPWAHNLYLELLAERGVVGLFAFTGMLASGLFVAFQVQKGRSQAARLLQAGAAASLCGYAASGLYETSLVRIWAVVLLLTLLGVVGSLANLSSATDPARRRSRGAQSSRRN